MPETNPKAVAPFLRRGVNITGMMAGLLACLTLTAAHFAWRYDPAYLPRYLAYIGAALLIEIIYVLLKDNRFRLPHLSTAVTAGLLTLSVPAHMPWLQVFSGILVAVLFAKLMVDRRALRLNPMLVGRLFLMLLFPDAIQAWLNPDAEIDAFTSATPLGLFLAEGAIYEPVKILLGNFPGDWEGIYAIIPGSPGDVMPLISIVLGIILYFTGIIDWRPGVAFIAGFALTCPLLDLPLSLHLTAGSITFTAVYIVTDPRSMPGSKAGRLIAGFVAGILNALVRDYGYYPEGIVLAVLAVNLLSPTLDRLAFVTRAWMLRAHFRRAH
jgi:electron transport complex protein RnfD